ncbi:MAG: hypothetical protein A2161_22500 [Candidatus Schekmanbacteria bacterium RBG_13_48_7]|uniref:Uncharacterized protein n=1 Tax=Candidatus Schekmanbacteria bacterium RBG_13_48_7 TaxID=1817878 RepID=A0A1F7RS91_9BACT|nr:MAG: hypothetical protein A2161_22500 [Candidatus Schekmanbacteria bacterium RBG_13_48_7]
MTKNNILLGLAPPFWPLMPPIGLGYLQEFLLKHGINTEILDLNNLFYNLSDEALKKEWLISCNTELEKNIYSIIQQNHHTEYDNVVDRMLECDVIGFSCFKSNIESTYEFVKLLKSKCNSPRIILGGPEITRQYYKNNFKLNHEIFSYADFSVVGEGEKPLLGYLEGLKNNVKHAEFEQVKNLDDLPFPRYKNLNFHNYRKNNSVPMLFSRGCTRNCRFCSERLLYKGFRIRGISNIIEEVRYHKLNNNITHFIFFDSMINADIRLLEKLCDQIIGNFGSINWEAQISIRNDMHPTLLDKMKRSGCYHLFVGLESGSDSILSRMNKGFTSNEAIDFFRKLNNSGLSFGVSLIVGYPGETDHEFKESLDFLVRNKDIIPKIEQINPFTYYDGTLADKDADYKLQPDALEKYKIFVGEIKRHNFKYTGAFLGNLIEKNAGSK